MAVAKVIDMAYINDKRQTAILKFELSATLNVFRGSSNKIRIYSFS